jgi:hypothetical protein
MPVEAQVHQLWYIAMHPEKLSPTVSMDTSLEETFPQLLSKPRVEQKRLLRQMIRKARSDAQVMRDPMTEPRPLSLAWNSH